MKPREESGPVFFPPLPNPPRIQHLASFSKLRDLQQTDSAFARFVLGERSGDADMLKKPYGVAVHGGKIYVADTRSAGIGVLDIVSRKFDVLQGSGPGKIAKPINIEIEPDGTKYVTDVERKQILVYDKDNQFIRAYGTKGQFKPVDVAVYQDRLYVVDIEHHQIQVLNKHTGDKLNTISRVGSKEGELFTPTNIVITADGRLFISDTGNYRVQEFTLDGAYKRSIGEVGSGPGKFARPKGIAIDRDGRLYVVDAAFDNVQVFDREGKLLLFFGGAGSEAQNLALPTDITIDYENVDKFKKFADPDFKLEYIIVVGNQFGLNKVNVFGFGKMQGVTYESGK